MPPTATAVSANINHRIAQSINLQNEAYLKKKTLKTLRTMSVNVSNVSMLTFQLTVCFMVCFHFVCLALSVLRLVNEAFQLVHRPERVTSLHNMYRWCFLKKPPKNEKEKTFSSLVYFVCLYINVISTPEKTEQTVLSFLVRQLPLVSVL